MSGLVLLLDIQRVELLMELNGKIYGKGMNV
jgi:hypothetical protein